MNEQIKGTDKIGYADYIHIIFSDKHIEFIPGRRVLDTTFNEILDVALKNGYKEKSETILIVAENPHAGKVYRYGNYGAFWVKIGNTMGYA